MNRECCGVINAWSESGQSENDDYCIPHWKFHIGYSTNELELLGIVWAVKH